MDAEEITTPGSICVQARKLFEIARLLPDAPVSFKKEDNEWVTVKCDRARFKLVGVAQGCFSRSSFVQISANKDSGQRFEDVHRSNDLCNYPGRITVHAFWCEVCSRRRRAKMVTTDGHRLAYVERKNVTKNGDNQSIDTLIPRKTLAELTKLTAGFDGDISLGMDENHIYFEIGPRLLISRMLYGQFPNYEMVMPKNNDKSVEFESGLLNLAIRRVALMADERSHAIRFHLEPNQLVISSQNAEEGEANETLQTEYAGEETDIGFNAQYLQEFLNVIGDAKIAFEFRGWKLSSATAAGRES